MPQNWKTYRFEDLFDIASGLSKSREEFGFGNPFVSFRDVFYNYFLPTRLNELVNTNEKEISRCSVLRGDIFLTRTSETQDDLGMSSVALKDYPGATFNGFTKRLRIKSDFPIKIHPEYIAYYLRSLSFRNEVSKHSSMTTRASLNNGAINSFEVTLPNFDEQIKIAEILKPLDDKIELNLEMNKTLEEMAKALYKHWFVDFGPFKDGNFVESELGMIPEGWEVKSIGDSVETLGGGTPSTKIKEYWDKGEIAWYSPTDLTKAKSLFSLNTAKQITDLGLSKSSAKLFPPYSLLMSSRATIGEITINRMQSCTNQGFITLIPNEKFSLYQLHGWLVSNMELIISKANGSTFKEISKSNFRSLQILVCPSIDSYNSEVKYLYDLIESNILENKYLITIRDTLLPKLISGEVEVKVAEDEVSNVV